MWSNIELDCCANPRWRNHENKIERSDHVIGALPPLLATRDGPMDGTVQESYGSEKNVSKLDSPLAVNGGTNRRTGGLVDRRKIRGSGCKTDLGGIVLLLGHWSVVDGKEKMSAVSWCAASTDYHEFGMHFSCDSHALRVMFFMWQFCDFLVTFLWLSCSFSVAFL
jgi:hypothetical protein